MITSNTNQQIKYISQLQKKAKLRNQDGVFVCEGRKMFEEVRVYAEASLVKAYASEEFFKEKGEAYFGGIDYEVVKDSVFASISETVTPQGIIAVVKQPVYSLEQMLKGTTVKLLMLEDLRDPGNLGTIMRTAEGAGMDGIIMSGGTVDIFNPKVVRSTMGAIFRVPFVYVDDFAGTISGLKAEGLSIFAAHLDGAEDYDKTEYTSKAAVMIGNEANGLTAETAALADKCIIIPMSGKLESLNASVAAALFMYEMRRKM